MINEDNGETSEDLMNLWNTPPGYTVSIVAGGYWVVFDPRGGAVFWSRDDTEVTEFLEGLTK